MATSSETLLRVLFYTVAMRSNRNAVLVFEEPGAHAFPYHMKYFGEQIAADSSNQYFIATHNPYLLTAVLEKAPKHEVALFVTRFRDYQTEVASLTEAQIAHLLDTDPFHDLQRVLEAEQMLPVYVECFPDEVLVCTLGVQRRSIRHAGGKGHVLKRRQQATSGTGLLDEDPQSHQPKALQHYTCTESQETVLLHTHKASPLKRIVVLRPRLEEWLYRRAAVCRLDPKDYGLPQDPQRLKAHLQDQRLQGFAKFLEALRETEREMQCLHRWLLAGANP